MFADPDEWGSSFVVFVVLLVHFRRPPTWPDENVGAASDRVILFLLTLMWL
jgi:hypothetical protein